MRYSRKKSLGLIKKILVFAILALLGLIGPSVIPDNSNVVDSFCFSLTLNIKNIILPSTITKIGNCCFSYCDIEEVFYKQK